METVDLKKYLSDVLDCEQTIFTAKWIRKDILKRIEEASHKHEKIEIPSNYSWELGEIRFIWGVGIGLWFIALIFLRSELSGLTKIIFIICLILSAIQKISAKLKNKQYMIQHFAEVKNAEEEIEKIKAEQSLIIGSLMKKLSETETFISETESALNALYSLGVIYGKYRHFVAVASFCEYIQSGRCNTLEGANGAYNLYESELRQNIIIGQLDAVIDGLKQIRDAQYMIYEAINESNRVLQCISSELSNIKSAAYVTAGASVATAYYAKQSAKNSEILVDVNRGAYGLLYDKSDRVVSYTK